MNMGLKNILKKTIKYVAFCAACATTLQTCNCNANCEHKCGCEDKKVAKSENAEVANAESTANVASSTESERTEEAKAA